MKSLLGAIGPVALAILAGGCSSEDATPPTGTTTTTSGGGGQGGIPYVSSGGAGGLGGAGGAGGAAEPLNICECLAGRNPAPETPNAPACAACFGDRVDTGSCVNQGQACLADPACKGIFDCLAATSYEAEQILACLPALDSPDRSHQMFFAAVDCICEACTMCESAEPIECLSDGPPNCGCILRSFEPGPCATCSTNAAATSCATQKAACDGNPDCASILTCLEGCADGDCVDTCFGRTGTPYSLAVAYFECTCAACVGDCGDDQNCD